MKLLKRLTKAKLIHPPKFLLDNTTYLVKMGSIAYGVSTDTSDVDLYGYAVPPKVDVFPYSEGFVQGFGKQHKPFQQWQKHHVNDKSTGNEYDFSIFSIVKYFDLCMAGNPNMVDSLFVPRPCIIQSNAISEYVRENRKLFLHKQMVPKFLGYAFSQMSKIRTKKPEINSKRYKSVQKYGYDLKYAYHLVRLCQEIEQVLEEHDLDLQRSSAMLKAIRNGEWSLSQVEDFFSRKEVLLEKLKLKSTLRDAPEEDKIKQLLLDCLEMHFGSLEKYVKTVPDIEKDMQSIFEITNKYKRG